MIAATRSDGTASMSKASNIWVVVPAYNEEKLLPSCLEALRMQSDRDFTLLVVDNNSTDRTQDIIKAFKRQHPDFDLRFIVEKQKGTGAACDSGFRYAIEHGAKCIARTDADAMADRKWIETIRNHFSDGKHFIAGRLRCRTDEPGTTKLDVIKATGAIYAGEMIARTWHRGKEYKYGMFMAAGLNLAIGSELYIRSGGFPRTSIDVADEDLELHLRIRRILPKQHVVFDPKLHVYGSPRRAKSYGYVNLLKWYWEKRFKGDVIDVR